MARWFPWRKREHPLDIVVRDVKAYEVADVIERGGKQPPNPPPPPKSSPGIPYPPGYEQFEQPVGRPVPPDYKPPVTQRVAEAIAQLPEMFFTDEGTAPETPLGQAIRKTLAKQQGDEMTYRPTSSSRRPQYNVGQKVRIDGRRAVVRSVSRDSYGPTYQVQVDDTPTRRSCTESELRNP